MSVNWAAYAAVMQEKIEQLSRPEQYRYWITNLIGAPYRWGQEGPLGTDCSGTIAFALWMMGYDIRTTATGLMTRIFTEPAESYDEEKAQAVFYLTTVEQKHGDRVVPAGYAIHVTALVGHGIVVNAGDVVTISRQESIEGWFEAYRRAVPQIRTLDWEAARVLSQKGTEAWGVDPILMEMRG